jgi:hypothetical protein
MISRREPSLRRCARERYLASAHDAGLDGSLVPPSADASAGKPAAAGTSIEPSAFADASADTSLTERVRALYEGSVVPVREIARLAGVSERTIYKYVRKGGWRRRHAGPALGLSADVFAGADAATGAANAGGGPTAGAGLGFAPVKGAGGRFIRREDKDLPQARGLKALDSLGAQRAAAACVAAGVIADQAAAAAAAEARARAARERAARDAQARMRTFERLLELFVELAKFRAGLDAKGGAAGGGDREQAERADRLAAEIQHAVLMVLERVFMPRAPCAADSCPRLV